LERLPCPKRQSQTQLFRLKRRGSDQPDGFQQREVERVTNGLKNGGKSGSRATPHTNWRKYREKKQTPNENAWQDYALCFENYFLLYYFVVNVSSPNTAGLRELQEDALRKIWPSAGLNKTSKQKPLLLKIAPTCDGSAR
jgi:dihydroorotate dehydrogenase